uniref:Uncharacterized protein n=1 Tax=Timema bartmani TaxID=61472 RepID=A0A7R9F786_9NEOP|nr:unnamed protein product [Timema bartmani]
MKTHYDKRAPHKPVDFKDCQAVVVQKGKIWEPGLILNKHVAPRSYIISDEWGYVLRRNMRHLRQSKHQPRLTQKFHTEYQAELQNTTDGSENDTLNEASNTAYYEPVVDNAAVNEDRSNTPIDNKNDICYLEMDNLIFMKIVLLQSVKKLKLFTKLLFILGLKRQTDGIAKNHFLWRVMRRRQPSTFRSALVSFLRTCTGHATHPLYCLDRSTVHVLEAVLDEFTSILSAKENSCLYWLA